jgi:alkylated DNA repair dioxygenase AlkB
MPDGFRYQAALIDAGEEAMLAAEIAALPLQPFAFRGYFGARRVHAFGLRYDYDRRVVEAGAAMPAFLLELRARVAAFAGRAAEDFPQALATEYAPGAPIGWHRDKPQFGEVVGVSLLSPATFRLRRREGERWRRAAMTLEPRSAYLLAGEARTAWEHSIPPAPALRYSLTFRTLAEGFVPPGSTGE